MKKISVVILCMVCFVAPMILGMQHIGGTGTYQMEISNSGKVVIMDTRTSEIKVVRIEGSRPFDNNERVISDFSRQR